MISNAQIKQIRSLHRKKGRSEHRYFIVEGVRAVEDVLRSSLEVRDVFVIDASHAGIPGYESFQKISEDQMKAISALSTPPGILAVVKFPQSGEINTEQSLILLDGIQDPGNMGTIIRTAHWFGVQQIVCSDDSVDIYNPKVVQATMGSIGYVNMFSEELSEIITKHREDYKFVGLMMNGYKLNTIEHKEQNIALIVGSEAFGIREEVENRVDVPVTISPGNSQNKPESLNASIAASIAIYHFFSA